MKQINIIISVTAFFAVLTASCTKKELIHTCVCTYTGNGTTEEIPISTGEATTRKEMKSYCAELGDAQRTCKIK